MRIECIEDESGDELGEVCCCPVCEKPWLVLTEGDAEYPEGCPHLRFVVPPMAELGDVRYRNGMTRAMFIVEIEKNFRRIFPDIDTVSAEEMFSEVLSELLIEDDAWETAEIAGVDAAVTYTQRSPGDRFTNVFGARLGS